MKSSIYNISEHKIMESSILKSMLDWERVFNTINDIITIHDKVIGDDKITYRR